MSKKLFATPKEAMERLCISYSTFIRKVNDKSIPSVKIGNQIRIPLSYFSDLEEKAYGKIGGDC